ncbi:DUF4127 family protein [Metabacillus sp. GX 13764]|uniref:DUF4127 family protein n=1 Tax=Metabacillus kandeliae TaxID=2900151 RepID=UPI001E4F28A5|nr:DUF4127 family protein [Metabacillus kandeliae]MCD7034605.1 DUF4127 family protein [Metabacillus kandeliae]
MKMLYLPLDERPCNTDVVERIAGSSKEISLLLPKREWLGRKKIAADQEQLWKWIEEEAQSADALILSLDMLIYGGLLPSRLHHLKEEAAERWTERLRSLRQAYPELPIYAFHLIMRTPKYSSSDEEPDYYEQWGREIFLRAYLMDKASREDLSEEEAEKLEEIQQQLPKEYIEDYETRRAFNASMNLQMLELAKEGVFTFLAIPQDDSAEFGYTAMDQQKAVRKRAELRLQQKVHMYPGADEAGATLLSRAYCEWKGIRPKIFPVWSSTLGPQLVPMYEDRPFAESLKAHVLAAGCELTDSEENADLVLAYNVPGRIMQESWEQDTRDITYSSFRNLVFFTDQIKSLLQKGKKVAAADAAFANGGDREWITMLDEEQFLDQLVSYKGWNTNCNTLGTTICQGVIALNGKGDKIKENLIYHLLDDYFYQAEIKMKMTEDFLPERGLDYFNLHDKADEVNKERDRQLLKHFRGTILKSFQDLEISKLETYAPWNRMFETGILVEIAQKEDHHA